MRKEDTKSFGVDLVELLRRDFRRVVYLDAKEERRQIKAAQGGSVEAMEVLTKSNLPWIFSLCKKMVSGKDTRFLDAINEGFLGLREAVFGFDLSKKTRLKTYAYYVVKRYISDFLMRGHLLPIPPSTVRSYRCGRVSDAGGNIRRALSVGKVASLSYDIPCEEKEPPYCEEDLVRLRDLIEALPLRERFVVVGYCNGMKYENIGRVIGLSRQRVHQIYHKVLRTLRNGMGMSG